MDYNDVKLGPIDRWKVRRERINNDRKIRHMKKKNGKDEIVDFDSPEELEERLLREKRIRLATKDAINIYRDLSKQEKEEIGQSDFIRNYLEKYELIQKKLPAGKQIDRIMLNDIGLESREKVSENLKSVRTTDGRVGVEYKNIDEDKYDTTRLLLGKEIKIGNHTVRECYVSWYNSMDVGERKIRPMIRGDFEKYTKVLMEINDTSLVTDPEYARAVMEGLLDKDRVAGYIARGLEENPEVPSGRYIGRIGKVGDEKYRKVFNRDIGKAAHELPDIVDERDAIRKYREKQQEQAIARKQEELREAEEKVAAIKGEIIDLTPTQDARMDDGEQR